MELHRRLLSLRNQTAKLLRDARNTPVANLGSFLEANKKMLDASHLKSARTLFANLSSGDKSLRPVIGPCDLANCVDASRRSLRRA